MKNSTYYEILGVAPHVGLGQLQAAYRFSKTLYAGEGVASYGLLDGAERAQMLALVEEAYGVLADANSRRAYDIQLHARDSLAGVRAPRLPKVSGESAAGPAPAPTRPEAPAPKAAPAPVVKPLHPVQAPPEVQESVLPVPATVNGAALRALREQRALSIDQIAALSKVGARFLRALEEDRHEVLPGRVFARGFLIEYARALRVSESDVVERYLRNWTGR